MTYPLDVIERCTQAICVVKMVEHFGLGYSRRSSSKRRKSEAYGSTTFDDDLYVLDEHETMVVIREIDGNNDIVNIPPNGR